MIDQPSPSRPGEALNQAALAKYLRDHLSIKETLTVEQFPSGYSNLTYLIQAGNEEFVLRKPPIGAIIKSAHDMTREFNVLKALKNAGFSKSPEPVLLCEDDSILGSKFYLMHRVRGVILRNRISRELKFDSETFHKLSRNIIDQMISLHQLDLQASGLGILGKGEGYVHRQVDGWMKRYKNCQTDEIPSLDEAMNWMNFHIPSSSSEAFIHNDYKYDNLVLDPNDLTKIIAILDWEMATVGDPWMDLGTTLAYWAEASDSDTLKPFNLTWMPGNMRRHEVLRYYQEHSGKTINNFIFYYVFGAFKVAVICQQIYSRYKKGLTLDLRFASLIHVIQACGENARRAIEQNHI